MKKDSREVYASNIIVIEVNDLNDTYQELMSGGAIISQPVDKGMFGSEQFIIKDYEDNKIIYKQKA